MDIAEQIWLAAKQKLKTNFQAEENALKKYEFIINCVKSFLRKIQKFQDKQVRLNLENVVYDSLKNNYDQTIKKFFNITHGKIINFINQNTRLVSM